MLWLYILLAIAAFFALILTTPIKLYIKFADSFFCTLRIRFVKIQLYPAKPKKKKPKKKSEKKPEKKSEEKEKKNIFTQKGFSGLVDILKQTASLAKGVLKDFFKHIIIKDFSLSVRIAGDDAADTAIEYGKYCSVIYPLVSTVVTATKCKGYGVDIVPDFDEKAETKVYFSAEVKIRLFWLLLIVLRHGIKALKILISINNEGE